MKWLGKIITSLILVALGAVILAAVQDPISDYFSNDRISAEIQFGQWSDRPDKYGPVSKEIENKILEQNGERSILDRDPNFARLIVSNKGQKTATDVRIKFKGYYDPDIILPSTKNNSAVFLEGVKDIRLDDIAPGEELIIPMWEQIGFSELLFPQSIQTFSSLGSFRMTLEYPKVREFYEDESGLEWFADEWLGTILVVLLLLILVLCLVGMIYYESYAKGLLKDDSFYLDEKIRFDNDPEKFVPTTPPTQLR